MRSASVVRPAFRGALIVALAVAQGNAQAAAREIMVFTAEGLAPMTHLEVATAVHELAPIDPLLEQLGFSYPGSEAAARARASDILNSSDGKAVLDAVKARANAAGLAWLAGIDYLPAVLVSPGYVVYGVYDVREALDRVEGHIHAE